ncbi:hypothetical protein HD806DRAFT_61555 [Xylariaceae sp. AK1471]|nr:hypothetical protein HD806DRAFT_61555 [Xylariaceae sp. AK1471]
MTTPLFPALTTTFTPPPECTSSYLYEACRVGISTCGGVAFKATGGCGGEKIFCYPSVAPFAVPNWHSSETRSYIGGSTDVAELKTYSPGLYCPAGMTTATTIESLDGVVCCPSGLTFNLESATCRQTKTEGTFVAWPECTPTTVSRPGTATISFVIDATPVFLLGQKRLSSSAPPSGSSSSNSPTGSPGAETRRGRSFGLKVGLGVGIPLVTLVLLYLASILIKRWRNNRAPSTMPVEAASADHTGKPELEGTMIGAPFPRAELDVSTWRAVPQGRITENSANNYIQKPELEGTDTSGNHGGGRVDAGGRWELDT